MKKLLLIFCLIIGCLVIGCSKKTTDSGGDGDDDEIVIPRLVADTTTLLVPPSTTDANDGIWDTIDSTIVQIGFSSEYSQNEKMIKDTVLMKVILQSDMIYIWAKWVDPTMDVWGNYGRKGTGNGMWEHVVSAAGSAGEDAFMIVLDAGDNGTEGADCKTMCHAITNGMATTGGGHADAWCWKSARLAPANLAEDYWWVSSGHFSDPPAALHPQLPYRENWLIAGSSIDRPMWMHPSDTAFKGPYLYYDDVVDFDNDVYIGWDDVTGYKMPGFAIDTSIYSNTTRDDRWNVLAASVYDDSNSPKTWTVVFSRTLEPATTNDVDLQTQDSIQVTVAASRNHTNGDDPGFENHSGSVPFYIILPRP